jgi:hypothetical protein
MSNAADKKRAELLRLEEEKALITRQLELLQLIDSKKEEIEEVKPSHLTDFPVGTPVKFSNPNEKPSLRGKTGEVIGHSPKFVRVKRGKDRILRAPSNLTPQKK